MDLLLLLLVVLYTAGCPWHLDSYKSLVTHCAYLLQHSCNEHAIRTPLMPCHKMDGLRFQPS